MSFKPMTIQYALSNVGKNAITYSDGVQEPITVPVNSERTIQIALDGTCTFTLTEANEPDLPLTVTLVQLTDQSARVLPQGTEWTVEDEGEQLLCRIELDASIQDQLTLDSRTHIQDGSIVIVGTVEIYGHAPARKKPASADHNQ
ncbi:MAG TPA: hypothetical protein VK826_05975 [Bacteroidia bacterium]|nr:hypothetical protein [Bacteroidia bacterium]